MTGDRRRPAGSGEKWKVTRAVRASDLPLPSKSIMFVLADIADAGTAEVPPRRNPSTAQLGREAGIKSLTTVKKHRTALEKAGWIIFVPPTLEQRVNHRPGTYKLCVPKSEGHAVALDALDTASDRGSADDPREGQEMTLGPETDGHLLTVARVSRWPSRGSGDDPLSTNDQYDRKKTAPATGEREDVERLCDHLADRIGADGVRPPITPAWREAARLLLDEDERTEEQVHAAIDFSQDEQWWRTAVLSMPSLRKNYVGLQRSAARARARAEATATPIPPPHVQDPHDAAGPEAVTALASLARTAMAENPYRPGRPPLLPRDEPRSDEADP